MAEAQHDVTEVVGKLCVAGDQACANGDLDSLRCIAERLAELSPEPNHCELVELAAECATLPEHALLRWTRLKDRLYRTCTK